MRKRNFWLLLGGLVATAALAAASSDRLRNTVLIGDGAATTKTLTFDVGGTTSSITGTSTGHINFVPGSGKFIGIRSTSPSTDLQGLSTAAGSSFVLGLGNSAVSRWVGLNSASTTGGDEGALFWSSSEDFRFGTSTSIAAAGFSEKVRIKANGNVGIGTTAPGTLLDVGDGTGSPIARVNGGSVPSLRLLLGGADSWSLMDNFMTANSLSFFGHAASSPNVKMDMDKDGNINLAPAAQGGPNFRLDVNAPSAQDTVRFTIANQSATAFQISNTTYGVGLANSFALTQSNSGVALINNANKNAIAIGTGGDVTLGFTGGNTPHACATTRLAGGAVTTVLCGAGKIATGGGCDPLGSPITFSIPSGFPGSTGWSCATSGANVTAYAVCCDY